MSGWKFSARRKITLGPLFAWVSLDGFKSWGWKLGPWTRNVTRGTHSIDTPGPGSIRRRSRRSAQ